VATQQDVDEFNRLIRTGDPANWQVAGQLATSFGFTPEQVLPYLNDPNIFPEFAGGVTLDTVKSFVPQYLPLRWYLLPRWSLPLRWYLPLRWLIKQVRQRRHPQNMRLILCFVSF
jgi:hypothetical protein